MYIVMIVSFHIGPPEIVLANVNSGVLVKVYKPTDWVHNLVIVERKNGSLHLCFPSHKSWQVPMGVMEAPP